MQTRGLCHKWDAKMLCPQGRHRVGEGTPVVVHSCSAKYRRVWHAVCFDETHPQAEAQRERE